MDNIATINGQRAMAYVGETPWHRLGVKQQAFADVADAMKAAQLNWKVKKLPIFIQDRKSVYHTVPDMFALTRDVDGHVFEVVTDVYTPLQNAEAFGVLDTAVSQFGVTIETAGALGHGERVWMLAKLPESIEPVPGDQVAGYFLLTTGHNGAFTYEAALTPIRVVCQNTLTLALKAGQGIIKLRHVKTQLEQLELVSVMITDLLASLQETGKTYQRLARRKLTLDEINAYIDRVLDIPNPLPQDEELKPRVRRQRDRVRELATGQGFGSQFAPMTAWAAYNAVTEYVDHEVRKNAKAEVRQLQADTSALFGNNFKLKERALDRALELVVVR